MKPHLTLCLTLGLISLSTASYAASSTDLDKAIDNMFDQMLECHKQDPEFKQYGSMLKESMNTARTSMKADMSNFTPAQADVALACLKSMSGKSCSTLYKYDTPECKHADNLI